MGKKICKYVIEMRRSSNIEGVFVITDEELKAVESMGGSEVHYGEIAGKYSEVTCNLHKNDIEILSDKEEEIAFFERILPNGAGFKFKRYWFNTDRAHEAGWEEGYSTSYKNAQEALEDYSSYNNDVMKDAFIEGFNSGRGQYNATRTNQK